ncbi:TPA: hypothetical protein I7730_00065 [Vibrio vulnificus]|uniref:Uncharacterized protein n=1 Tax=Vibrio vulnificus TaxID=672 RepID=A0A8H9K6K7_VIBVL|nr:hypothetical protein [Vibrio vulnificus]HAS8538192.1 hypothetical protein [Vibrio vulnificus]
MIDNCLHCGSALDIQEFCTKDTCPHHDYSQTTEFDYNWKPFNTTPFFMKQRVMVGDKDLGPELMGMKNSDSPNILFEFCNKILDGDNANDIEWERFKILDGTTDIKWQELAKWLLVNDIETLTKIAANRTKGSITLTLSSDIEHPVKITVSPDDLVSSTAEPDKKRHHKGAYLHICTISYASVICNVEFGFATQCVDEQKEIVINTKLEN